MDQNDQHGKYLRLFGTLFFAVIGFILALVLLLLFVRVLFGLMSYIPWFTYIYMIFILLVPAGLFIPAYLVYFKRTATHPRKFVKWFSYCLFSIAILAWTYVLISDMVTFFRFAYPTIGKYLSFDMVFLAANVFCFFFIGIIQALTMLKEKDWMHRN